jgi:hypothetical protein
MQSFGLIVQVLFIFRNFYFYYIIYLSDKIEKLVIIAFLKMMKECSVYLVLIILLLSGIYTLMVNNCIKGKAIVGVLIKI